MLHDTTNTIGTDDDGTAHAMEEYLGVLELPRARSCTNTGPLRNPGYTAYGGCVAHGGLRVTAGEFYDFNHCPHLVEVVEPHTLLTCADSLVRMLL